MSKYLVQLAATLRAYALSFPGAVEEFPWGESVAKVKGKVFVFLGKTSGVRDEVSFSVKLPHTGVHALDLSYCEPTGYGLGKSGWVTFRLGDRDDPGIDLLKGWIEESYRAVAPKKLVKELGPTGEEVVEIVVRPKRASTGAAKSKASRKKPSARKPRVAGSPAGKTKVARASTRKPARRK